MKLYRPNTVIGKYYAMLFSLPHVWVLTVFLLILGCLIILFLRESSIPYIAYMLSIVGVIAPYSRLTLSVFKRFKRVLGLTLITTIYALIIGVFTSWDIGLLSSTVILVIALQGLDGTRMYRYIIALIPFYIVVFLMHGLYGISIDTFIKYLLASITIVVLDLIIYWYLSRFKIGRYGSAELGTYYMWNWLEKRRKLDEVFESLAEDKEVNPVILRGDKYLVIYTDVHYGPFSNIGSSMLPKILHKRLASQEWSPLILHGMGSHDRDLGSSKIMREYVEYVLKLINDKGKKQLLHGVFKLKGDDNWEVTGVALSDVSLLFISRPGKGIDDLPYELQLEYNEKARKHSIGQVLLIDSHNWEKEEEFDLDKLKTLLDKALITIKNLKNRKPVEVMGRALCISCNALGVIDGDLCGLEICGENTNDSLVLIYMRGNNMAPHVRDKIIDVVKQYFPNSLVEVLTNDEHTETGTRSHITYLPVQDTEELLQSVNRLADLLVKKDYDKELYLIQGSTKYPLLGDNASKLIELLKKTYPRGTVVLLSYIFLTPILVSLILSI